PRLYGGRAVCPWPDRGGWWRVRGRCRRDWGAFAVGTELHEPVLPGELAPQPGADLASSRIVDPRALASGRVRAGCAARWSHWSLPRSVERVVSSPCPFHRQANRRLASVPCATHRE